MALSSIERQSSLDALRGFALLGILVVNIIAFATPYYGTGVPDPMAQSRVSHAVMYSIALLFEWKFYLLFSFLFGYSFTLQMQSAERDGKAFVPRMLRRLAGLWVLGLLHGVLLYHGDILTTYAVVGAALLMLRNLADKKLAKLAVGLIVGTAAVWAIVGVLSVLDVDATHDSKALAEITSALTAFRSTPSGVIAQHVEELKGVWVVTVLMQAPTALAMFLIGCIAGRRGLFSASSPTAGTSTLFKQCLIAGACVGLPAAVAYAYGTTRLAGTPWDLLGLSLSLLTAPLLTAAYIGGMQLLFRSRCGQWWLRVLAPAGRMALSNYLMQSLVCSVIFLAYGFRMMGQVGPLGTLLIAFAIFAVQTVISRWWLQRFAYGPVEWLLRAVTHGQFSSLRAARAGRGQQPG